MTLRALLRRALPAVLAATATVAAPAAVRAQAITYTFAGFANILGGNPSYVLTFKGDASNVFDASAVFDAAPKSVLLNTFVDGTVSLNGGPAVSLASLYSGVSFGVGMLNNAPFLPAGYNTGAGVLGVNGATGEYFGMFLPSTAGAYGLTSNYGAVTGTSYFFRGSMAEDAAYSEMVGASSYSEQGPRYTALGPTSFQAQVTATPEPASLALLGSGLAVIGGVVARRRRQQG